MSAYIIKVTTEELKSKSDVVKAKTANLKAAIEDTERLIAGTASYWVGSAGDQKRRDFAQKKDMTDEIVARLGEYVTDLLQTAGIYEEKEKANVEVPSSLPMDLIV